ncbi:MAG: hypothetical protein AMS27_16340 [Bacteroides sp. SM23_62_1]|nr:MAG: hypothetical protein AMS27_16340 [Bacteroides sp. SM23_62_1]
MRSLFFAVLFIIIPYSHAQIIREYLIGGSFSGKITQAKHLQWGNMLNLESTINCEVLRSFNPLGISNLKSEHFYYSERNKNLFSGLNISLNPGISFTDTVGMSSVAIGPGMILKYYTPVNLFFQALIGFEFDRRKIWEPNPKSNTFFTPAATIFGFKYELFIGYSFHLSDRVLFEPTISYKVLKSTTYIPDYDNIYLPRNSINIYLGFLFVYNKYLM